MFTHWKRHALQCFIYIGFIQNHAPQDQAKHNHGVNIKKGWIKETSKRAWIKLVKMSSSAAPFAITDSNLGRLLFSTDLVKTSDEDKAYFVDAKQLIPNELFSTTFVPNDNRKHTLYKYTNSHVANRIGRGTHEESNERKVHCSVECHCSVQSPESAIHKSFAPWKQCGLDVSTVVGSKLCRLTFAMDKDEANIYCKSTFAAVDVIELPPSIDVGFTMTNPSLGRSLFPVKFYYRRHFKDVRFVDSIDKDVKVAKTTYVPRNNKKYRLQTIWDQKTPKYYRHVKCSAKCECLVQSFEKYDDSYRHCGLDIQSIDSGSGSTFCKLSFTFPDKDSSDKNIYCKSVIATKDEVSLHSLGAPMKLPEVMDGTGFLDSRDYNFRYKTVPSMVIVPNNKFEYRLYTSDKMENQVNPKISHAKCSAKCDCGIQGPEGRAYQPCQRFESDATSKFCKLVLSEELGIQYCKSFMATPEEAKPTKESAETLFFRY